MSLVVLRNGWSKVARSTLILYASPPIDLLRKYVSSGSVALKLRLRRQCRAGTSTPSRKRF